MCLGTYQNEVAGMCLHLAAKWSGQAIPSDTQVTNETLEAISEWDEFVRKCPLGLRNSILASEAKRIVSPSESEESESESSSEKRKADDEEELSPLPRKKVLIDVDAFEFSNPVATSTPIKSRREIHQ